eukprot:gnl/MRDRNA2_/MRDRNA2_133599_c0_seq1.p1 gnl/MRDRNA2_/MRDRNA2_133599_c0~~gnl/MRDRNA2_/MRDRNA2_133599_c0_seq1.p1  ORF type:complete len:262 (-),score=32.65 gnl/MRDRNA2_/MRDRNA2_133599_c0_seq1:69-854(-)
MDQLDKNSSALSLGNKGDGKRPKSTVGGRRKSSLKSGVASQTLKPAPVQDTVVGNNFSALQKMSSSDIPKEWLPAESPETAKASKLRRRNSDPALLGPAYIPGAHCKNRSSKAPPSAKARKRRASIEVLTEPRGIAWEGLILDSESWDRLRGGVGKIPGVDRWVAGRNSSSSSPWSCAGGTILCISTRWASNDMILKPIQQLLQDNALPQPTQDAEFLQKWLKTCPNVGAQSLPEQKPLDPSRVVAGMHRALGHSKKTHVS